MSGACDAQPDGGGPDDQRQVIAALIRTIFAQPDRDRAVVQLRQVVDQLHGIAPTVAERLQGMEDDLLAYATFPPDHWSKIWSNNPIERLNRELKPEPTWCRYSPTSSP